jgi:hypothetical protein
MVRRAGWPGGKGILMSDSGIPVMEAILVGAPDPEIVAMEARVRSVQLNADVDALDQLIADDLLFTGPDGNLATKADDLAAHRSGLVRFRKHEPEELRIRRVGADVAIAGGSWRVVGGHVSPCGTAQR